jgi:large subunit ribosomal protein L32e
MTINTVKVARVIKRNRKYNRFQSNRKAGSIKPNWRKPKGIDCAARRMFKGKTLLPNIGYGSDTRTRYKLNNGFMKFIVKNQQELEMLIMQHRTFIAVIAHGVSARKRKDITERASSLNICVLNQKARLTT